MPLLAPRPQHNVGYALRGVQWLAPARSSARRPVGSSARYTNRSQNLRSPPSGPCALSTLGGSRLAVGQRRRPRGPRAAHGASSDGADSCLSHASAIVCSCVAKIMAAEFCSPAISQLVSVTLGVGPLRATGCLADSKSSQGQIQCALLSSPFVCPPHARLTRSSADANSAALEALAHLRN